MSNAAIYASVGTPNQDQATTMSGLSRFAVRHGLSVLEYPERHARAGTRPVYSKMLRDAASHKFDFVIVESLDCLALSLADLCAKVTELHRLGIRLIAVNEHIDLDPGTVEGRKFLSTLTALVNVAKNMVGRKVREGMTRAQSKAVHCGRPRRSFPCAQALELQKQGLTIRDIATIIGYPVSSVGRALKTGSGSCVQSGGDNIGLSETASTAGKRSKRVPGTRQRQRPAFW
jgi:DNA invertase Pin-like site-specific DNA recombinase